jgi:adenylate kinase
VPELNLILIGPPGAGKGTQADRLQQDFNLPYIATGDMMRAIREEDTPLAATVKGYMNKGELVPDEIVCKVLLARVDEEGDDGFLLDGFPRNIAQADILETALGRRERTLTAALLIEADDDVIVKRISGRRVCPKGHVYHVEFDPPKHEGVCDQDGTKLQLREDDEPETVLSRLRVYHEQTEPLIEYYEGRGLLRRFNGDRPPTEVHDHIRATLATLRLENEL